jgi:hypothetical protein
MSTSSSASQSQVCQAPAGSDVLLQLIRQRQGLSDAMSATESNIQQLLLQLSVAPTQQTPTSSPVSQDQILQGLGGPGLLQLLLLRIQLQQGV